MVLRLGVAAIVVAVTVSGVCGGRTKTQKSYEKGRKTVSYPTPAAGPIRSLATDALDSVPAVAPQVSYQDGNLTILAHNSNLTDILKAVQVSTGATIDVRPVRVSAL